MRYVIRIAEMTLESVAAIADTVVCLVVLAIGTFLIRSLKNGRNGKTGIDTHNSEKYIEQVKTQIEELLNEELDKMDARVTRRAERFIDKRLGDFLSLGGTQESSPALPVEIGDNGGDSGVDETHIKQTFEAIKKHMLGGKK